MASTVTNFSKLIDTNFPIKGQGNIGTSGFNNNFNKIKSSFNILSNEIDQLTNSLINLKTSNNFGNTSIISAVLANHSKRLNDIGLVTTGRVDLNYNLGTYHKVSSGDADLTFNTTNWPLNNRLAKIRLEIQNNNTTDISIVYVNFSGNTKFFNSIVNKIEIPSNRSAFFDIWSIDSGQTINIKPLGIVGNILENTNVSPIVLVPPVINSISISAVPYQGGTSVTVNGINFGGSPIILINGTTLANILSSSNTVITFESILGTPGTYQNVFVRTNQGDSNSKAYYLIDTTLPPD